VAGPTVREKIDFLCAPGVFDAACQTLGPVKRDSSWDVAHISRAPAKKGFDPVCGRQTAIERTTPLRTLGLACKVVAGGFSMSGRHALGPEEGELLHQDDLCVSQWDGDLTLLPRMDAEILWDHCSSKSAADRYHAACIQGLPQVAAQSCAFNDLRVAAPI